MYHKSLITQSVTKRDFPKYQALHKSTYQTDSVENDINRKLWVKADSLVGEILTACQALQVTLFLDGVETSVLLSHFAQQLRRENADLSKVYFNLLEAASTSPNSVLNQTAKTRGREWNWVPCKIWTSESANFEHARWCCSCAKLTENQQATNIESETSFAFKNFLERTHSRNAKMRRMKTFSRFKNENWCYDMAFVDELAHN